MLGTFFDQLTDYQLVKKDSSPLTVPNKRTRVHADLDAGNFLTSWPTISLSRRTLLLSLYLMKGQEYMQIWILRLLCIWKHYAVM